MKKLLLTIFCVMTIALVRAQITFQWGLAEWNIEDGFVYDNYEDFSQNGVILTYPNPTNYTLTMFHMLVVDYEVFTDEAEEPVQSFSSGRGETAVRLNFDFREGHSYRIVTKSAVLAQFNFIKQDMDTLSVNSDSYTISFSIKGPELVKTIDVEQRMSLAIWDQEDPLTFSLIDTNEILEALGIQSVYDATVCGLQANGAYVPAEWIGTATANSFDGWRDADGDYTNWGGGYNQFAGHNAYYAVYSIKLNETCDTVKYYFYDYWRDYDPNEPEEMGGSGINPVKGRAPEAVDIRKAPDTHFYYQIVEWYDEENDTTYLYRRNYRCDVGSDYKASFVVKTNEKYVQINATMHFVSEEDYLNPPVAGKKGDVNTDDKVDISDIVAIINQIAGTANYENADVNADEKVDISDIVAVINIIASGE